MGEVSGGEPELFRREPGVMFAIHDGKPVCECHPHFACEPILGAVECGIGSCGGDHPWELAAVACNRPGGVQILAQEENSKRCAAGVGLDGPKTRRGHKLPWVLINSANSMHNHFLENI